MTRYKTRKINVTYRLSKWRQRCEIDSWWQTGGYTNAVCICILYT